MTPRLDPTIRERLLEAAPEELAGLRAERPELAAIIDALEGANAEIQDALEGRAPLSAAAGGASGMRGAASTQGSPPKAFAGTSAPSRRLRSLPLLAAAAVLLLAASWAVLREGTIPERAAPTRTAGAHSAAELAVEAPGTFAVFPTDDPDMAIIWLLNGDD